MTFHRIRPRRSWFAPSFLRGGIPSRAAIRFTLGAYHPFMRLLVTADLHYNHARSGPLAERLIDEMNAAGGDVLLLVGDTAVADGDSLERCLSRFRFAGPKLFVAGNHELWTNGSDSYELFTDSLPAGCGRWVGSGWRPSRSARGCCDHRDGRVWYDYSFAQAGLGIPRRFYEQKVSPGAAERLRSTSHCWSARRHRPGGTRRRRAVERRAVREAAAVRRRISVRDPRPAPRAAPRGARCPDRRGRRASPALSRTAAPGRNSQWDFTKAYLGSEQIGQALLEFPNVTRAYCGHSHMKAEAQVGHVHTVNIGSGYGWKTFLQVDL